MSSAAPAVIDRCAAGLELLERARLPGYAPIDRAAIARVCERRGIRLLALFGSQATGRAKLDSDVDVAYLCEPRRRPDPLNVYADLVPVLGSSRLDVVNLRTAPPLLAWNVTRTGLLLYAVDEREWTQFQIRAMKQWDDARKFEKYRLMYLDQRLKHWHES